MANVMWLYLIPTILTGLSLIGLLKWQQIKKEKESVRQPVPIRSEEERYPRQ